MNRNPKLHPEDTRVSKAGADAGFFMGKVSLGKCVVTIRDIELAGFGCAGSCREYTSPRDDEDRGREDGFEEIQKLAQCWKSRLRITRNVLEVKITNVLELK